MTNGQVTATNARSMHDPLVLKLKGGVSDMRTQLTNSLSSCSVSGTTMGNTTDYATVNINTATGNTMDNTNTLSWPQSPLATLRYHLHTIYLFTYSSHKDTIYPNTLFALSTALSPSYIPLSPSPPSPLSILLRTPHAILLIYLGLLLFSLHNQHHPSSILEDSLNKPWRPLPSQRITPSQTRLLLVCIYPLFLTTSHHLGALTPSLALTALTIYYCELGGCSHGGVLRNLLNALGYSCFFLGGLQALVGPGYPVYEMEGGRGVLRWLVVVCSVVFTTIHAQDFRDEEGDRARGRTTVQTALGDAGARWAVVVAAGVWSVVIPRMFGMGLVVMGMLCGGAGVLAYFLLSGMKNRTVEGDIRAYRVWIGWFMAVILSPLVQTCLDSCLSTLHK